MIHAKHTSACQPRGFSLLELLAVIIIISVLLGVAIDRLMRLQVVAERATVDTIVGNLQSAIALTIGEHVVQDRIPDLHKYINSNPMELLASTPPNYLGSFAQTPKNPPTVSWWFDTTSKTLLYHVGNKDYFQTESLEKSVIKFKIRAVYDDINRNGRFDRGDKLVGLKLSPLARYRWLNEPIDPAEYMLPGPKNERG